MNDAQKRAISHKEGPARVLAGPGSGKTFVIVQRLKYLLEQLNISPSSILVITFTKAAARQMQERFIKVMDDKIYPIHFGTFHAIFYYILQKSNSNFSKEIISESDKIAIIGKIRNIFNKKFPDISLPVEDELLKLIGKFKNVGEDLSKIDIVHMGICEQHFKWLYSEYNRFLLMEDFLDFDDMAKQCLILFEKNPHILSYWQERFKYVLIDEFQDINKPQYDVIKMLVRNSRNIFVVGDDDQSIYGFRGANPQIMQDFLKDYPESECILLDINYRSADEIVNATIKCITENKERIVKDVKADTEAFKNNIGNNTAKPVEIKAFANKDEEYNYIVQRLLRWEREDNSFNDAAIICRTNFELEEYAIILEKEKIPYSRKEKSRSIFEHPIMKDLEAYLRIANGERGRNLLLQIINHPGRGIGRYFFTKEDMWLSELKKACMEIPEKYSAVSKLEKDCQKISKMRPFLAVNYIRKGMGYDNYLKEAAEGNSEKFHKFTDIINFIEEHAKGYLTSKEWLEAIDKHINEFRKEYKQSGNLTVDFKGVNLITMHGSKGLEFPMVIIPDVNEGVIPKRNISNTETEEERRIFYVAMTRAKSNLELYYVNGKEERKRLPSRFIKPLLEKQSDC